MALGRAVWTGQLRLSLVALPVRLYAATESGARLKFHQIHEPSGKRIRYEKVVPGVGPVDADEIVKGFELDKGEYVLLSEDELDDVKIEARKTVDLVQFVDACEIDPIYYDRPYYVAPDGDLAGDAFRVVRDALRKTRRVGLGQIVMRGREYIAAVKPCNRGLLLETLRFEAELRNSDPYFAEIEERDADKDLRDLAKELIERKSAAFDASVFTDQYSASLRELIDRKIKGKKGRIVTAESDDGGGGEVIDLMAALKRSLSEGKGRKSAGRSTKRPASRRKTAA